MVTSTQADLDDLVKYMDNLISHPATDTFPAEFNEEQRELIIDALVFYKEMNTY